MLELELELGGKRVTTTEGKQQMLINGNPVEVERIGNAIYVNKTAINLIIPTHAKSSKTNWTKIILAGAGIAVFAGVAGNFESALGMATGAYEFVVPYVTDLIGTVSGYVVGSGTVNQ